MKFVIHSCANLWTLVERSGDFNRPRAQRKTAPKKTPGAGGGWKTASGSQAQFLAMPALFFRSTKRFSTGIFASKTRLKKPTIISSQLCSPQVTSWVGSAFSGLAAELSKCAVHSMRAPLGSETGSVRLYQFCQCQS